MERTRERPSAAASIVRFDPPAKVSCGGFVHGSIHGCQIGRDVVFEAALADIVQQLLKPRNAHHARTAERLEWIIRELAVADIAIDRAFAIVGGKAREAHGAGLHTADART